MGPEPPQACTSQIKGEDQARREHVARGLNPAQLLSGIHLNRGALQHAYLKEPVDPHASYTPARRKRLFPEKTGTKGDSEAVDVPGRAWRKRTVFAGVLKTAFRRW